MNSRERILAALSGRIPDRVPVSTYELVGYNGKAFENNDPSYANLMRAVREKTDCICMWEPSSNATFLASSFAVELDVQEYREGDVTIQKRTLHTRRGNLSQTTKIIAGVHTTWQTEHWCKSLEDVDAALSVPFEPLEYDVSDYARIKGEVGDHGIIMASLADPLWLAADLMSFGDYTVWAKTETEHFAGTIAAMHERVMENLRRMLAVNVLDLYRICGPEYATPPFLPPEFFKRFVVPYVSQMVDLIRSKGAKVRFHCHGRIGQILDMIVETGSDGIDPCEGPPDGDIPLRETKERVGDRMCIFGNLQLKLLEHGSAAEVEKAVKECMDSAKRGGGYVIMPTAAPIHSPLAGKTEENYLRFIEAALEYGKY
jgi:uroporphyrinogen-III decarboxylase